MHLHLLEYAIPLGVLAAAVAYGLWVVVEARAPLRWSTQRLYEADMSPRKLSEQQPWLILLPARWMRWSLRRLQWIGAAALALATFAVGHNPGSAAAWGWIGFWLPEIILRDVAWERWQALDRAAFSTLFSVRFYIAQGTAVLEAWRKVLPNAPPVFQRWIEPCLMAEVSQDASQQGGSFERLLKDQALAIHHTELAVTADILTAQRTHGGASTSLEKLLKLWGTRIELDADRRGNLSGFVWLGRGSLMAAFALFWALSIGDATVRIHMHSFPGMIVTGIASIILALATTMYYKQNRLAEQF